ncbi:EamA family transporter [Priestia aryabhattai]|uniref:Inner membrane transporter RhtA n=1 Tax=Priestia megaterium Q3 TaxID=1452722 RepID=A0A806U5C1_PRIMG|nr:MULTISPECIES: EamA family transporter [Priestia]AKP77203.1 Inner membrane transporter RhtA [Priestia megaterium Q3]MBY0073851.1 EamA family transporter [Priestia aryabhattai]MED3885601.1 EamA family transporter [Priestia aryabhattai]MED3923144.1 EamA family transporter [Priestia aryabhattai]MED3960127.1 EamA family transporter [Priestia aryabhattai]
MNTSLSKILILCAAVLWGTTGTAQALASAEAHSVAIGAVRLAVGGLSLLTACLIQRKNVDVRRLPILPLAVAAASMAAYQPLFFSAVIKTGVAVGTMVAIGSAPVLSGVLDYIVYRKKPTKKWLLATVTGIIGCSCLLLKKDTQIDVIGLGMAIGAGASFACYTTVNKKIVQHVDPQVGASLVFTAAAVLLIPCWFMYDMSWLVSLNGMGIALHLGILTTAIAYVLFSTALKSVQASTAVTLSLAEPVTAFLLGVFFLGESLTLVNICGAALVLASLVFLTYSPKSSLNQEVHI